MDIVVIATFNEADNIASLIAAIRCSAPAAAILVVDDDSPDGTSDVVDRLRREKSGLSLLTRKGDRGYGSAVSAGLKFAIKHGFERVLTMDADFSHDPSDIPQILSALERADVAVGSRYIGGIRVLNWDARRLFLSIFANTYLRVTLGVPCADCTSGFRAYRVSALEREILEQIRSRGYAYLSELLFRLWIRGATITEVPVCYAERRLGESKMSKEMIVEAALRPGYLLPLRVRRVRE